MFLKVCEPRLDIFSFRLIELFEAINDLFRICQGVYREELGGLVSLSLV